MAELTQFDLSFVMSRIPKDVITLLKENKGLAFGGGFIRATIAHEKVSDIDMFGSDAAVLKIIATTFALKRGGRLLESKNALTVLAPPRIPVQFITRWLWETPEAAMISFDFTICQTAIWFDQTSGKFCSVCSERFYSDLAARRLYYTAPERLEAPGGSLLRVRKFLAKGYNIQAPSLARVVYRLIRDVDFQNMHRVDCEKVLIGLLREVDPLTIVDGVDVVDEHEVLEGEK